jgi:hypothetical protein
MSRITRPNSCYYFAPHIYSIPRNICSTSDGYSRTYFERKILCQHGLKSEPLPSHVLMYDVNCHIMYALKRHAIRNDMWLYTNGLLFIVHARNYSAVAAAPSFIRCRVHLVLALSYIHHPLHATTSPTQAKLTAC